MAWQNVSDLGVLLVYKPDVVALGFYGSDHAELHAEVYAGDARSRNWYQKLAPETFTKNLTQVHHSFLRQNNSTTLHGSCHVPDSFCASIELCSTACKKLVPEKNWYQTDRHTCKFFGTRRLVPVSGTSLWACVAGIRARIHGVGHGLQFTVSSN